MTALHCKVPHVLRKNTVMPALVADIHVFTPFPRNRHGWPGQSPAMTLWFEA
jgi:hypothetical protein